MDSAKVYAAGIRRALNCSDNATLEGMIHRALGRGTIRKAAIRTETVVAVVNGETAFCVSSRLSPARSRWALAHAFAAWAMRADGVPAAEANRLRSPLAAELLLPTETAIRVLRVASATVVAEEFVMPTAATMLREAEVLRVPTALVVPGRYARVRGDDKGRMPLELHALELLASRRGIGVVRVPVPEEGGVVLRISPLLRASFLRHRFLVASLDRASCRLRNVSFGGALILRN